VMDRQELIENTLAVIGFGLAFFGAFAWAL
jgi:preprotein translocase subunit SecE